MPLAINREIFDRVKTVIAETGRINMLYWVETHDSMTAESVDEIRGERKKAGEMRVRLTISVTGRSQITNLIADTQSLQGRKTWRNLPSIFLILHGFDYLPRFFSLSARSALVTTK